MTDRQIIHSLCCCNGEGSCQDCEMHDQENCTDRLRTMTACRLAELSVAVEQKSNVSQETANSQENLPDPDVQLEPERATEYISISVAEYHCLTKAATMLEVILANKSYSQDTVVAAVRNVVNGMNRMTEGGVSK